MYKIIILLLGGLINSVYANELSLVVPFEKVKQSGLPNATPMQFVIDRDGTLIYHHVGTDRGIKGAFKRKEKMKDGELLKKKLLTLFEQSPVFSDFDYTLVFVTDERAAEFCPPCVMQAEINRKVINSMGNKSILLISLAQHFVGERTGSVR